MSGTGSFQGVQDTSSASSQKAQPDKDQEVKIKLHHKAVYYFIMFFAHWFGQGRFLDFDGDDDFDPEDVAMVAKDPSVLLKHFTRTKSNLSKAPSTTSKSGSMTTKSQSSGSAPAEPATAAGADDQGAQQADDGNALDRNHDGQVNLLDLLESDVDKVQGLHSQGEEMQVLEAYRSGQQKPVFVAIQSILTFVAWFILAIITDGGDFLNAKAGLASFDEELFDLRVTTDCEDNRFQVWRWFTYQWTHIGISHVAMNTLLLILFGIPLEGVHGSLKLCLMFNIGVLGGACCTFLSDVSSPVVGMSGGDYALMGMTLADLVMNWHQKKFRKPTAFLVITLAALDMLVYNSGSKENTSHSGHFGGYVAGTLIGMVAGHNYAWSGFERKLQVTAFVIGAICFVFCVTWSWAQWPPRTLWTPEDQIGCWIRAVWDPTMYNTNDWVCVRCSDDACINSYASMQYIEEVSADWCNDNPA